MNPCLLLLATFVCANEPETKTYSFDEPAPRAIETPQSVAEERPAEQLAPGESVYTPWFTGSVLAPNQVVVTAGHVDFFASYTQYMTTGVYNTNWKDVSVQRFTRANPQIYLYVGMTPWMDFYIVPQYVYNWSGRQSDGGFGDLAAAFEFQIYPANIDPWYPGLKIGVQELFPVGKHDNLNPAKLTTDAIGCGSFATSLIFSFYKVYPIRAIHFLSLQLSGLYTVYGSASVQGFNAYGGGRDTRGTVLPGSFFQGIFSFEYSLSQRWNVALDTLWTHTNTTRFASDLGMDASVGFPSSDSLSFCPAIEYSFSETLGLIGGAYFTALGRNTAKFASGTINLTYYH